MCGQNLPKHIENLSTFRIQNDDENQVATYYGSGNRYIRLPILIILEVVAMLVQNCRYLTRLTDVEFYYNQEDVAQKKKNSLISIF